MTVFAIDTSSEICSIAFSQEENIIAECSLNIHRAHSERLIPIINSVIENMDLSLRDVELIAVANGPGSFTGLRIGLSTAKGLAFANSCPLVSVVSLDTLAFQAPVQNGVICPLIQARKNEFYSAIFEKKTGESQPQLAGEYKILKIDALRDFIPEGAYVPGNGVINNRQKLSEIFNEKVTLAPDYLSYHRASASAILGYRKYNQLQQDELQLVEPFYLQDFKVTRPKKDK